MKRITLLYLLLCGLFISTSTLLAGNVKIYSTTADLTKAMSKSETTTSESTILSSENIISLKPDFRFQQMDGFGAAITGSSCYNLLKMTPENRKALLTETFDPVHGYGYSFIRISIGCSDFSLDEYTCCDEPGIKNFRIHEYDKRDLFPVLKEILAINPNVKILASPWTCPKWMKVNNLKDLQPYDSWTSGQLNPHYYQDYALYFVRFVQEMKKAGFDINAITIQNEPLNRGNSASLYMSWQEQRDFIKKALGPAFRKHGIKTRIWAYDHNYNYDSNKAENVDQGHYPLNIYNDPEAAQYVDGAAYHAYGGNKNELKYIHNNNSDKGLFFTEMSIGLWGDGYNFGKDFMWSMREVCLGTINNFSKAVIMWNYMLDDKHGPDRPGGCNICLGAIDIQTSDYATLTRNSHFYEIAHLASVIKPGAWRVSSESTLPAGIHYAAFLNPDGSYSVVLQNDTDKNLEIKIVSAGKAFVYNVEAKSVSSYLWNN